MLASFKPINYSVFVFCGLVIMSLATLVALASSVASSMSNWNVKAYKVKQCEYDKEVKGLISSLPSR